MDCRTKENPERTFDLVLKVKCHASEDEDPEVLWKFPEDFADQEVLQTVPKFCFPFDVERVSQNQVGQHFAFVLTDIESKQRFGFCRLKSGGKICLCILSYLPWFEVYYKLLNTLADYLAKELDTEKCRRLTLWLYLLNCGSLELNPPYLQALPVYNTSEEDDLHETLKSLYNQPVPNANTPVNLSVNQEIFIASEQVLKDQPSLARHSYFIAPDVTGLPTIPESRNLTEYFVAVDANNMLQLYASMLHERRIIITSGKLSTLTACVHGSVALLFPMYWQHIYIPVLPPHLLDYCCAPMPYLIGIHSSLIERVKNKSLEDVVMLNVDTNTLESPFNDLSSLPSDVVSALKNKLKKQSTATGNGVARAFLRAQAALFGSYRDALRYKPGEPITFCEESFVKHRSSLMKQFLETAVNLQLFKQFIDGRLAKLNAGKGFSDVFEEEITSGGFCGGNSRSYQQWVHTVKKGGALLNTAMTKATPAVRTAYKFAKNHAKQGIKEVKSKLRHKENEDDYGTCSGSVQYTPVYTLPSEKGRNLARRKLAQPRLRRPLQSLDGVLCADNDEDADRASKLSSEDGEEASAYFYESDDSLETRAQAPSSGEMDLLGEILDTLSTHSLDKGKLAAARSLDFFRSMDDIDYKPTNKSNTPSENNLALLCGGSGDQTEWHLGQDDSALHGRQLPPSPRKRVASSAGADSLSILKEEDGERRLGAGATSRPAELAGPAPPPGPALPLASPGASQTEKKETLSQTPGGPLVPSLGRRPSFVPWEKEGKGAKEISEGSGLLQEVVSLCHITSAFQQDLNISEGKASGNQA
ncbi:DENN domain-containing protein 1B isoform X3 [Physeter macrocephalus]|uniref:DENN domain-containing protein 1B isoform X3 n=1 Tax=Physeter macrocephalus TaxID=9755 RepID=A0A2Y9T631_PHYMC|nr:DENN domain-containing protein 1B isoform X3 [Physeter catodon]|eukprot:XP_023986386.1 DENN domain-containing protein 1B isoform X1 [Physeter catodon]